MSSMLSIRPFQSADVPILRTFVRELHDFERELIPALSAGEQLTDANVQRILADVADGRGTVFVAWLGESPVGFGCVLIDDFRDPAFPEPTRRRAYISYLYVDRPYRRRGFARRLLTAMEDEARWRGCARLVTRCKAANGQARACYQSAGFEPFEVIVWKPLQEPVGAA
jgi:GNAT superfamily N-acetyltransferase